MLKRTPDQLIEFAYERFLELASAELSAEQIVDITLEFEERGAVEATLADAQWSHHLGVKLDLSAWREVQIGLLGKNDEFTEVYAKALVPLDASDNRIEWQWFPKSA